MIEVHATDSDDPGFLMVVSSLIEGLTAGSDLRELHLIHIDNWFDHKWLEFAGKTLGALGVWNRGEHLTVPAFTPNRVLSHQYFARTEADPALREESPPDELHKRVWSAANLQRRVSEIARSAALVWYSSNTIANRKGAVMAYIPIDSSYDTWYVSLAAKETWIVEKTKQIIRADFDALVAKAQRG